MQSAKKVCDLSKAKQSKNRNHPNAGFTVKCSIFLTKDMITQIDQGFDIKNEQKNDKNTFNSLTRLILNLVSSLHDNFQTELLIETKK